MVAAERPRRWAWVEGDLIGTVRARRHDPASAYARFRALAPDRILNALDLVFDLPDQLAAEGWIAVDFYDGCLIYDFSVGTVHVIDLDNYRYERDQVELHLQLSPKAAGLSACYVTVDNVDSLYADFQRAGVRITRTIEDSSYGGRDFNIADADGNTIGFGSRSKPGRNDGSYDRRPTSHCKRTITSVASLPRLLAAE